MARLYISLPNVRALVSPLEPAQFSSIPTGNDGIAYTPQSILAGCFYFTMHLETPCIFAATYVLTVKYLNACNRKGNHKPWKVTESVLWKPFVLLHNSGLAAFSLATFIGVYKAVSSTLLGQNSPPGLAAAAKSLCQLHGQSLIDFKGNAFGRLSTDDVAFWAWIFYLSKFYEVLDTFIMHLSPEQVEQRWNDFHPDFIKSLAMGHLAPVYEGELARDDHEGYEEATDHCYYHEHSETACTKRCMDAMLEKEREDGCGCGGCC